MRGNLSPLFSYARHIAAGREFQMLSREPSLPGAIPGGLGAGRLRRPAFPGAARRPCPGQILPGGVFSLFPELGIADL
jgi:hypothetical protein